MAARKKIAVVAVGGNALIRAKGAEALDSQYAAVADTVRHVVDLVEAGWRVVLTHGNGPQVGLLALQQSAYAGVEPYPLDVLGAQTEGMIGYVIEQELGNLLPFERPFATILSMTEVDPDDPAFRNPT